MIDCSSCGDSYEEADPNIAMICDWASNSDQEDCAENYFGASGNSPVCEDCWDDFLDSGWDEE